MADPTNLVWLTYLLFPAVGIAGAAVIMGWMYRSVWDKRGAKLFFVLIGIGMVWALTQFLYLLVPTISIGQLLLQIQTVVAMVAFVMFVVFVSVYTESGFHRHPIVIAGNGIVLTGSVVLAATNRYHDLLFATIQPVTDPFQYLYVEPGLGFVGILLLIVVLIGYSWIALVLHFLDAPQESSTQMLLILAGGFSIAIVEILGNTGMLPAYGMNHAVYGTLPFLLFSTVALFRLGMFDIQPVARNTIVENLRDSDHHP
ncbi:MAG: histidine kinase N-terminal 7TM domain-containing protein [Natrialbaceae archaeon]|nr:histidine kinase N-terminal 7TM domain-containing protein [Natrialbaceae archaeon]